jgi:capsular exopolysaccharide synthesis family protein
MTIQDALERAKLLRKTREGSRAARDERARVSLDDTALVAVVHEPEMIESEPAVHYGPLERIEFDLEVCSKNNVLVTDEQLAASSHAAAAFRLMRGRVLHRMRAGKWSCVGITSAGAGEGKTMTTINLAISIAREKQRMVYVLDLDMRRPSVLERVGCRPPNQLSEYFAGAREPEQVLYETSVENLVIAGVTSPVQGPSELLASRKLEALLKYIRRRSPGALIIIDLPPVASTDEALVVAPRTDAMFLVVSEGLTRRESLAKAVDLLSDFTVAGVILNRSTQEFGGDYYGY